MTDENDAAIRKGFQGLADIFQNLAKKADGQPSAMTLSGPSGAPTISNMPSMPSMSLKAERTLKALPGSLGDAVKSLQMSVSEAWTLADVCKAYLQNGKMPIERDQITPAINRDQLHAQGRLIEKRRGSFISPDFIPADHSLEMYLAKESIAVKADHFDSALDRFKANSGVRRS